jgi:hypothetical protein
MGVLNRFARFGNALCIGLAVGGIWYWCFWGLEVGYGRQTCRSLFAKTVSDIKSLLLSWRYKGIIEIVLWNDSTPETKMTSEVKLLPLSAEENRAKFSARSFLSRMAARNLVSLKAAHAAWLLNCIWAVHNRLVMIYEVKRMETWLVLESWSEAFRSAYLRSEKILDSLVRKEETVRRTFSVLHKSHSAA